MLGVMDKQHEKKHDRISRSQADGRSDQMRTYSRARIALHRDMVCIRSIETNARSPCLNSITPGQKEDVLNRLQRALRAKGMDEIVCAVCGELALRRNSVDVFGSDCDYMSKMKQCLKACENLPSLLVGQHDCSNMSSNFTGLLLSRRGIKFTDTEIVIRVCQRCHLHIKKGVSTPPKFAIANGFFVGTLPDDLHQATWPEQLMTQLVTVVAQTRVMRGGLHKAIRPHCMIFDAAPGPPATLLPRKLDDACTYRVILAGSMTAAQIEKVRKLHLVRHQVVKDQL